MVLLTFDLRVGSCLLLMIASLFSLGLGFVQVCLFGLLFSVPVVCSGLLWFVLIACLGDFGVNGLPSLFVLCTLCLCCCLLLLIDCGLVLVTC